jgi:hypothetical protein
MDGILANTMNNFIEAVRALVGQREFRISLHGYRELAADGIPLEEVVAGISSGIVIEEYPDFAKGPCALVLQRDSRNQPLHVVWGIPKNQSTPAVLVTAYRPDPARWSADFTSRRNQ